MKKKIKLDFESWMDKYFYKDCEYKFWTSNYERQDVGFAPDDLSRYKMKDLKNEYEKYLVDENDFLQYKE